MLLSNKKVGNAAMCYNIARLWKHYAKWNKLGKNVHIT